MLIDLHLHSTASDGRWTPDELVAEARARGLDGFALTDHDTVAGVPAAMEAARDAGLWCIPAIEINADAGDEYLHILGYGINYDCQALREGVAAMRAARRARAEAMLARLTALDCPLTMADVEAQAGDRAIGRPHIGAALVAVGYVPDKATAFARLIGEAAPAYVKRARVTPAQAISRIHTSGGLAVLAHPGNYRDPWARLEAMLAAGVDGIEAYHARHTSEQADTFRAWAADHHVLITGGSDSHGPDAFAAFDHAARIPAWVGDAVLAALGRRPRADDVAGRDHPGAGNIAYACAPAVCEAKAVRERA